MLNSKNNAGLWLAILLCSAMSSTASSKVYSWKDKHGDTHYSQFPRKMVEKNVAQSRATRKQAKKRAAAKEVVKEQVHFLNGLDDIVATASVLKEPEKQLKRAQPQKIQQAQIKSVQATPTSPILKTQTASNTSTVQRSNKKIHNNTFLTGVQRKLRRQSQHKQPRLKTADVLNQNQLSRDVFPTEENSLNTKSTAFKIRKKKRRNDFLAGVNKKRSPSAKKTEQEEDQKSTDAYLAEINRMLVITASKKARTTNTESDNK